MKNKQIIVVGLGRFGNALAETLVENGCEVMAIDTNEERLDEIAPRITHTVCADATDAEAAEAMLEFFPDADVETLKIVANSYRKTDSWMADPIMTEEAFTRLQDIIDINGELKARVEFGELVDNSFAEAVVKGK